MRGIRSTRARRSRSSPCSGRARSTRSSCRLRRDRTIPWGYTSRRRSGGRRPARVCSASEDPRTCFEKTFLRTLSRSRLEISSRAERTGRRARLARSRCTTARDPLEEISLIGRMRIYDTVVTRNEASKESADGGEVETEKVPRLAVSPSRDPSSWSHQAARARARRGADWEIFPPRVCRENTAIISTTRRSPSALLAPRACVCPPPPACSLRRRPPSRPPRRRTRVGIDWVSARNTARGHPRRRRRGSTRRRILRVVRRFRSPSSSAAPPRRYIRRDGSAPLARRRPDS